MGNVNIKYNDQSIATMYDKGIIRLTGTGKVNSGNIDVTYTPDTTPSIGFVPTAWDSSGRITEGVWYGNSVPSNMFSAYSYGTSKTQCVSALKKISFIDELTIIGNYAFNSSVIEDVQLPDSVTNIGDSAFGNCRKISSIVLPKNLLEIGQYAFSSCYGLTHIQIPESVTTIKSYAFQYCNALVTITVPSKVTSMTGLFESCTSLTTANILGVNVTYMSSNVFINCPNLTTINVPWSEGAVDGAPWGATNATINYNYTPS